MKSWGCRCGGNLDLRGKKKIDFVFRFGEGGGGAKIDFLGSEKSSFFSSIFVEKSILFSIFSQKIDFSRFVGQNRFFFRFYGLKLEGL